MKKNGDARTPGQKRTRDAVRAPGSSNVFVIGSA